MHGNLELQTDALCYESGAKPLPQGGLWRLSIMAAAYATVVNGGSLAPDVPASFANE